MTRTVRGAKLLITGAASDLGRRFAQRAVAEGAASLVLWDVDAPGLARLAGALGDASRGRTVIRSEVVDVSELGSIAKHAQKARKDSGTPDILINTAGISPGDRYFWETDNGDDTRMTMRVNAMAPMYLAREFLPGMIADAYRAKRIVNLASVAGAVAAPRMAAFAASKAAVSGWSHSLRLELEQADHTNVKVLTVTLGAVGTGAGALDAEVVADQVWRAMLRGDPLLELPGSVRLARVLRAILPTRVSDLVDGAALGSRRSAERVTRRR
ncbi:SDR family NAD(P)-dependent oxidoreductase [Agromyces sp. MMS24-JH15]|uniref:SDR family NAD(P)-dependent oxidoreductase n=1 Tax=Agromyces sp. MMS24-JH15 TaxID=3243765 RepID=UPI003749BD05